MTHSHGHAHQHEYEVDWSEHAARLAAAAHSNSEWYENVAAQLVRPHDRTAADVGCGAAGMVLALAKAIGKTIGREGLVLAVDGNRDVLAAARSGLDEGLDAGAARVETVLADLDRGVEEVRAALPDGGADIIWGSASVHHLGDQQAGVTALAGLLAPVGRLALAEGGLKPHHLPWNLGIGEPGLELRFVAAQDTWFARMRAALPGSKPMPYGWTTALSLAGLTKVTTRSQLIEHPSPVDEKTRDRILHMFTNRVERLLPTGLLPTADAQAWRRLLDPKDTAWLGHRDDLYWLEARSVHIGQR